MTWQTTVHAAEHLIRILSDDVVILMTDKNTSLLGRGISITASSNSLVTACMLLLMWSCKLQSHIPLFLWRQRWVCSYRHILHITYYRTSLHHNWVIMVLSSRPDGSSKMVRLHIQWQHPWRSFVKSFQSMLFHCAASSHDLISLLMIILFKSVHH
jgi:hypothetical protein